ncbi:hypothetical protein M2S00_06350 [Apilactobacillus sp. TMW 2.2459]|uniref:hypothetical protein n=1 Tax=Apilactobacillus xinyiensis TaxID=2841032 RepID=UPI0020105290|nr:hypothetical protein [Apilactobacillus xinyiensis]MCL0312723.1 hypothetical protein [Apilactobacillus xinyiensis]
MLIDDIKIVEPVISGQLKNCGNHIFIVIDENKQTFKLNIDKKYRNDKLFWSSLYSIAKEKLWVPITRSTHQLINNDWLVGVIA